MATDLTPTSDIQNFLAAANKNNAITTLGMVPPSPSWTYSATPGTGLFVTNNTTTNNTTLIDLYDVSLSGGTGWQNIMDNFIGIGPYLIIMHGTAGGKLF